MTTIVESDHRPALDDGSGALWKEPLKAFLVFAVIQAAMVVGGITPFFDGTLAEPDAYMRLNRVMHLWQSGAWFDPTFPRIGLEGHVQHWTRPLDLLLLLGGAVAAPFVGFETGLHWWGMMIGPVLQLPALLALVWAAAPLIRREGLWLVGVLFVVQLGALLTFLVGRPDQNSLLILLFVLTLGLSVRMLLQPERLRNAALAGATSALALWVSVETMLFVVVTIAVAGAYWLFGDRRLVRALVAHAGALFAALLMALLIERGLTRFAQVEFDMISVAHLQVFGFNLLYWCAMALATDRLRQAGLIAGRAVLAGSGAAIVLGVLWWTQPGFFQSPFAAVDELYRTQRLVNIAEFQPAVQWATLSWAELPMAVSRLVVWLGAALIAIPWLIRMCLTGSTAARRGWVLLACLTALFVPMTLMQIRWVAYAETLLVIPYAGAICTALRWISGWRMAEAWRAVPRALCVSLACIWVFVPAMIVGFLSPEPPATGGAMETGGSCPLAPLSAFLAEPSGLGDRQRRVMAYVDFGPELLYRTPHSVYSIPNHRFQPGFTATHRTMTAGSVDDARQLIRENRVELILVCPHWRVEALFYGGEARNAGGFYYTLADGPVPEFLEELALPETLARHFRIYSVRQPR